jgi:hypothetical protein
MSDFLKDLFGESSGEASGEESENNDSLLSSKEPKDLFEGLSDEAARSKEQVDSIKSSITSVNSNISIFSDNLNGYFSNLSKGLESVLSQFKELQALMKDTSELFSKGFQVPVHGMSSSGPGMAAAGIEGAPDVNSKLEEFDARLRSMEEGTKDKTETLMNSLKKHIDSITRHVEREFSAVQSKLSGMAGSAIPGMGGTTGLLTGLLNMVILGVKETQRIGAEAGELKNVFAAVGEDLYGSQINKVTKWFSNFQEHAQWQYAIPRQETQAVLKTMVDSGAQIEDIMKSFDKSLGEVGSNVPTLTLGLDSLFKTSAGTHMKDTVDLVKLYGESYQTAAEKITEIGFAGQRSGMGVREFATSVLSASSHMVQYGIDVKDVANTMGKLQRYYEDMGLGKQYSGQKASESLNSITSGIGSASDGALSRLADKVFGPGDPVGNLNRLREGFATIAKGENPELLTKLIKAARDVAEENAGPDRDRQIFWLMEHYADDIQGAGGIIALATGKADSGKDLDEEEKKKLMKNLSNSFKVRGETLTELQKVQRELIAALRDIGQGILKVLVGLVGVLVVGFRALPALGKAALMAPGEERDKTFANIHNAFQSQIDLIRSGVGDALMGADKLKGVLGKVLTDIFGPLQDALSNEVFGKGFFESLWELGGELGSALYDIIHDVNKQEEMLIKNQILMHELIGKMYLTLSEIMPVGKEALKEYGNRQLAEGKDLEKSFKANPNILSDTLLRAQVLKAIQTDSAVKDAVAQLGQKEFMRQVKEHRASSPFETSGVGISKMKGLEARNVDSMSTVAKRFKTIEDNIAEIRKKQQGNCAARGGDAVTLTNGTVTCVLPGGSGPTFNSPAPGNN